MVNYDHNWINKCYQTVAQIQSHINYAAIETTWYRGIGILLYQGTRSWELLKLFYDRKPDLFTEQSLIDAMNTIPWYVKKFNWNEYLNVQDILMDKIALEIEDDYFDTLIRRDIPTIQKLEFTNPDTAIMAWMIYFLTDEYKLNMVVNNCGGARGTTPGQLRISAIMTYGVDINKRKLDDCFKIITTRKPLARQRRLTWVSGNRYLTNEERQNNVQLVYPYFSNAGWSVNAIAALCSNMEHESTINPGIWQDFTPRPDLGWGLVQWTPSTKYTDWADAQGIAHDEPNAQMRWINEVTNTAPHWQWGPVAGYEMSWDTFKTSTESPEYLARAFLHNFEKPTDPEQYDEIRSTDGRKWFDFINNLSPAPTPDPEPEPKPEQKPTKPKPDANPPQKPDVAETVPPPTPKPPAPEPPADEPDQTEEIESPTIKVDKMLQVGHDYHLIGENTEGTKLLVQLYRENNLIWTPNLEELNAVVEPNPPAPPEPTPDPEPPTPEPTPTPPPSKPSGVPVKPPTPAEPNPEPPEPEQPTPEPTTKAEEYVALARTYVGNLAYSQTLDTDRFSFSDNYADCSSFVVTLYYMITGEKLYNANGELCTWTGNLWDAGKILHRGDGGGNAVIGHMGDMLPGDIVTMCYQPLNGDAHVVIYGGDDQMIHCKNQASGTVEESFRGYFSATPRPQYTIARLFYD